MEICRNELKISCLIMPDGGKNLLMLFMNIRLPLNRNLLFLVWINLLHEIEADRQLVYFFSLSTFFITSFSSPCLYSFTFFPIFSSKAPIIVVARMPAFLAAFKATVATGMPFGI